MAPIVLCPHTGPHVHPAGCPKSTAKLLAYVHDKVGEIHARVLPVMEDLVWLKVMLEHLYDTAIDFQVPAHEDGGDSVEDEALDDKEDEIEEVEEVDL